MAVPLPPLNLSTSSSATSGPIYNNSAPTAFPFAAPNSSNNLLIMVGIAAAVLVLLKKKK